MRVWTYVPVDYAYRVAVGTEVEIQPRLVQGGNRNGRHPIEQKKFRGKSSRSSTRQLQAIGENGVRVFADLDNPAPHELRPGPEGRP